MKYFHRPKSVFFSTICICLLIFFASQNAFSQDSETEPTPSPTATPESAETRRLKEQIELLKLQKEKELLENAINDAKFPKPTTTPLEGKTELEGVKIESQMQAYKSLRNTAQGISTDILTKRGNAASLTIFNSQWLKAVQGYWATRNQFTAMEKEFNGILVIPEEPVSLVARLRENETGINAEILFGAKSVEAAKAADKFNKSGIRRSIASLGEQQTFSMVNSDSSTTSNEASSGFIPGLATTIGSFIGPIGSMVGAFIDVAALARTDTKITGFDFTVEEGAVVSEVYRGLKSKSGGYTNLYYPNQFSPNVNLQSEFVISKQIDEVFKKKALADQLVLSIESTEEVLKKALADKKTLEARKESLADLIKAEEKELEDNKRIYKNTPERFKFAQLLANVKDNENNIKKLKTEQSVTLPKKIEENKKNIEELNLTLDKLYKFINLKSPEFDLVTAFLIAGDEINSRASEFLKRSYSLAELKKLSEGHKETKEILVKEAEKTLSRVLTDKEKDQLQNPLESERLGIYVKIGKHINGNIKLFSQEELSNLLTYDQQLKLSLPLNSQVDVLDKVVQRRKSSVINKLKILNKQFDEFFSSTTKIDGTIGVNPLTLHIQTENLLNALGCDLKTGLCEKANALVLNVISVGGNNRVKKNLLTMVFTGDQVDHSGGAIVEYKLYDMQGKVIASSVCTAYEKYSKAKKIDQNSSTIIKTCEPSPAPTTPNPPASDYKLGKN